MKIRLIIVGKGKSDLIDDELKYFKRIEKYIKIERVVLDIKHVKNSSEELIKIKEAESILSILDKKSHIVLLDEKGAEYSSTQFSKWIENRLNTSKPITFIIGGAYGFSQDIYDCAHEKIALSKLTFTHHMVRLFFAEQLYRAFTIMRNEPYHHGK